MNAIPFISDYDESNIRKDIVSNPEQFVKKILTGSRYNFGVDNILSTGFYREMGFKYDLRPFLTLYVYKQYEQWQQIYALNKTNVRQLVSGRIIKIVEVK